MQVRVLLDKPEPSLRHKIEQVLEHKAVRLVKIETSYPTQNESNTNHVLLEDVSKLQPEDIFLRMYQQRYQNEPDSQLLAAFRDLLVTDIQGDSE